MAGGRRTLEKELKGRIQKGGGELKQIGVKVPGRWQWRIVGVGIGEAE